MRIVISSHPKLLHILRGVVRYRAYMAGFEESDADWICLAIDEAATNVIRHSYKNHCEGKLALDILTFPDRMEFVLEDSAPKVNPAAIRPRALDDIRPGGLGIHFMHAFMDSCRFDEHFTEGNRLIMIKHRPQKGLHRQ